jgi:hypothetical protein
MHSSFGRGICAGARTRNRLSSCGGPGQELQAGPIGWRFRGLPEPARRILLTQLRPLGILPSC